jgi:hypothetical protein
MRMAACGGVRHPRARVTSADTGISVNAKSAYDGAAASVKMIRRTTDPNGSETRYPQMSTTGHSDTATTTVWTATSVAIVQLMRQKARPFCLR